MSGSGGVASRGRTLATLAGILLAWAGLSLAVNLPPHIWALFTGWHLGLALEVGAAFAVLALWRGWRGTTPSALVHALAALLVLLVALRLADLTARSVVDRPLNLFLDVSLLPALSDVARTLLGPVRALALAVGLALGLVALHSLLVFLLRRIGSGFRAMPVRRGYYALGAMAIAVFAMQKVLPEPWQGWHPVGGSASRAVAEQAERLTDTLARRTAFRVEAATDPAAAVPDGRLLARLDGRDVLVVFIESYGTSALDDPRYANVVGPRLDAFGDAVTAAGWSVTSGRLVSPTAGGQSWLAHATLTSGLWVDDQTLYSLFLAEDRSTLVGDFDRTGRRTVQLMPAITLPWPEGRRLGYDVTYEAADMGYRGPPFYWGIVPDQFALDVLADRQIDPTDRPPVFALAALISSHAPWLPVPEVVPWDALDDGAIYRRWTEDAPEPREVWRDREAVRDQYALSVAHSLDVVAAFVADRVDPADSLVIVAGDHQPAPLITGPDASRAVPVHVLSGDPSLLAPFGELGFAAGIRPPDPPPAGDDLLPRMDAVRPFLLDAFSRSPATAAAPPAPAADR